MFSFKYVVRSIIRRNGPQHKDILLNKFLKYLLNDL